VPLQDPLLLRGALDYMPGTVSELPCRGATGIEWEGVSFKCGQLQKRVYKGPLYVVPHFCCIFVAYNALTALFPAILYFYISIQ